MPMSSHPYPEENQILPRLATGKASGAREKPGKPDPFAPRISLSMVPRRLYSPKKSIPCPMKTSPILAGMIVAAKMLLTPLTGAGPAAAPGTPIQTFRFTMTNDNPFLNLVPGLQRDDDFGPTQGTGIEYTTVRPAGFLRDNERWSVQLRSELYTRNLTPAGQDLFPLIPQAFNELSTLNLIWDDIFTQAGTKNLYHVFGLGLGLVNDSKSNGALAIGQQTAWHHFKHYHLTPDETAIYANQLGTTHDFFGTAKVGAGRVFPLGKGSRPDGRETDLLKVEGGAEWLGTRRGSSVYLLAAANRSLWHSGRTGSGSMRASGATSARRAMRTCAAPSASSSIGRPSRSRRGQATWSVRKTSVS